MSFPEIKIPQEQALVPLKEAFREQNTFTVKQREDLRNAVVDYCSKHNIRYDKKTSTLIRQVIGDCFQRGQMIKGETSITPRTSVSLLVDLGLKERRLIEKQAKEMMAQFRTHGSLSFDPYLGAFALEKRKIVRIDEQLRHFTLSPDVSITEEVLLKKSLREEIIKQLFAPLLTSILKDPLFFGLVKTELSIVDRAKLIRNALLAGAFKTSPLLTIDNLFDMVNMEPSDFCQRLEREELVDFFVRLLPRDSSLKDEAREFLNNLRQQVKSSFTHFSKTYSPPRDDEEMISVRDKIYKFFFSNLLIIHPAFEEKLLVTDPHLASQSSYHLWQEENSEVMGNFRVPKPEILRKAHRLAMAASILRLKWVARRYRPKESRFSQAIEVWTNYLVRKKKWEMDKVNLEREMAQVEEEQQRYLGDPNLLPPLSLVAGFKVVVDARDNFNRAKRKAREAENTLKRIQQLKSLAEKYEQEMKNLYGSLWPNQVPKPKEKNETLVDSQPAMVRGRKGVYGRKIDSLAERVLVLDYFDTFFPDSGLIMKLFSPAYNPDFIRSRVRKLKEIALRLNNKDDDLWLSLHPDNIVKRLEEMQQYSSSFGKSTDYFLIEKKLATLNPAETVLFCLKHDIDLMEQSLRVWRKYERTKHLPLKKGESQQAVWSREQAQAYIQETKADDFPEELFSEYPDLDERIKSLESVLMGFKKKGIPWPSTISQKADLLSWLHDYCAQSNQFIERAEDKLKQNKIKPRARDLLKLRVQQRNEQLKALRGFEAEIENPLLPFSESQKWPKKTFFSLVQRRLNLAKLKLNLKNYQEEVIELEKRYHEEIRKAYLERLKDKIEVMERRRSLMPDEETAKQNFLKAMKELNLLAEVVDGKKD